MKRPMAVIALCLLAGVGPALADGAPPRLKEVQVSAKNNGNFGTGSPREASEPMVQAMTVRGKSTIIAVAKGSWCFGGNLCTGPDGTTFNNNANFGQPLQQTIGAFGGTVVNMAALMGAFVPDVLAAAPGFQPLDGTKLASGVGIMPNMLFFVGRFNVIQTSGPGTLYLGINDEGVADNSGTLTVTVEASPRDGRGAAAP